MSRPGEDEYAGRQIVQNIVAATLELAGYPGEDTEAISNAIQVALDHGAGENLGDLVDAANAAWDAEARRG